MLTMYVICLIAGAAFAALSFILSGGFEAHVDAGLDHGTPMDAHGDIAGGDADVGAVHFPFLSPVVIASFVTAFGAGGLAGLKLFGFLPMLSVLLALASGAGIAFLMGLVIMKLYKLGEVNATTTTQSLVGKQAEVTESIPASGLGEISFSGKGSRISGPARSEENRDIKRHALVTITRVVGGLYYVREHVDEKLRDVAALEKDKEP